LVFDENLNKHLGNTTYHTLRLNPRSGLFVGEEKDLWDMPC
jgi:hypothetical protein